MIASILNLNAKVAIIIDQPSTEDQAAKKLMSDPYMQMMWEYLMKSGITPQSVSIIPVVRKRHPRLDRIGGNELHCWKELLQRDLNILHAEGNLNLIVTIGEIALQATTGKREHNKYRGSVIPSTLIDCKTLVLWSPTHASDPKTPWINVYKARPEWKPFTCWDCDKLKSHKDTKEYLRPGFCIEVCRDLALLEKEFLSPEYINNPDSQLGFDIEASYSEMTCIGFAKTENKAYVIPLVHMHGTELANALKLVDRILRSPVRKAAQNGNFDITFLAHYYKIKVNNFYWDTMLAFHSMYPNLPKGLGILGSIFTEAPYWKDMAKGDEDKQWKLPHAKVDWATFFQYNGEDSINMITIWNAQAEMIKERGTWETFRREMALCYPLIAIECFGVKINLEKKEDIKLELELEIAKWELFFHHLCMENSPNIQSPMQLKAFLYDKMKLPKRVKKGKITADVDALTSLLKYNPYVIKPIMILRDLKKQRSFTEMKIAPDGRTRTTFKPGGTQTGRLSSSGSITGVGGNLQQQPKFAKKFYIPDEGKIIIQADYSKAESWIVAALAEDPKMLEALYSADFHSTNATNLLGRKVTKANYGDRQLGKRVSHGSNYGMSSFLLQSVLAKDGYAFDKKETDALMETYHMNYPGVRSNYHNWIKELLEKHMTLENAFGRKTTFFDQWGNRLFNKAFAWIPQSTIGDMASTALINVYERMGKYSDLLVQVHDSLVIQTDYNNVTQSFMDELTDCMIIPLTIKGTELSVPIDIELGTSWYDLHEWDESLTYCKGLI